MQLKPGRDEKREGALEDMKASSQHYTDNVSSSLFPFARQAGTLKVVMLQAELPTTKLKATFPSLPSSPKPWPCPLGAMGIKKENSSLHHLGKHSSEFSNAVIRPW